MKNLISLSGRTRAYKGNGRKLGYPTANIQVNTDLAEGIYFGFANLGKYKKHPALIFIGIPKTVGDSEHRVEAYLLDITDNDYYDQKIQLEIHHFWRPNQKFKSLDELITAIKVDEAAGRRWFKKFEAK